MNLHKHARLTPRGRALLVQRRRRERADSLQVDKAISGGRRGWLGRSSRPRHCPHATSETLAMHLV